MTHDQSTQPGAAGWQQPVFPTEGPFPWSVIGDSKDITYLTRQQAGPLNSQCAELHGRDQRLAIANQASTQCQSWPKLVAHQSSLFAACAGTHRGVPGVAGALLLQQCTLVVSRHTTTDFLVLPVSVMPHSLHPIGASACLLQAQATGKGPLADLADHLSNPGANNWVSSPGKYS